MFFMNLSNYVTIFVDTQGICLGMESFPNQVFLCYLTLLLTSSNHECFFVSCHKSAPC